MMMGKKELEIDFFRFIIQLKTVKTMSSFLFRSFVMSSWFSK